MTTEAIARLLKPLSAPLGVYAVLGNHDFSDDAPRMAAALRAAGIAVLDNRSRVLASGPLTLVGIGDTYSHNADPRKALAGVRGGALCFTHSPDVFPQLPASCLLTVAAHTHGGQVRLPLLGRPAVPFVSIYGQRYAAGLIREGGKTLFVSTGLGTSGLTVRFGVTPEVSLLEIQ